MLQRHARKAERVGAFAPSRCSLQIANALGTARFANPREHEPPAAVSQPGMAEFVPFDGERVSTSRGIDVVRPHFRTLEQMGIGIDNKRQLRHPGRSSRARAGLPLRPKLVLPLELLHEHAIVEIVPPERDQAVLYLEHASDG